MNVHCPLERVDSLLPVLIGVTGHRSLPGSALEPVEAAVRSLLRRLDVALPHTPIHLLSPLAEGADRLVARCFLDLLGGHPANRLLVPLPLPVEEYRKDFAGPASVAEFDSLLARGEVLELASSPENRPGDAHAPGPARDREYLKVGRLIGRNSHLLVALWDGDRARGTGGTGEIVEYRLHGPAEWDLEGASPLDIPDLGPVYHVLSPRDADPGPGRPEPGTGSLLLPGGDGCVDGPSALDPVVEALGPVERFNEDALDLLETRPELQTRSIGRLWPDQEAGLPLQSSESRILQAYGSADALALHFQRRWRRSTGLLLGVAVLLLVTAQAYGSLTPVPSMAVLYLVLLVTGAGVLGGLDRLGWQERYLSYRALAEGLRVQFFWRLAGVDASVASGYLRSQREELHGVRQALRYADLGMEQGVEISPEGWEERVGAAVRRWVRDQRTYFLGPDRSREGGAVERELRHLRKIRAVRNGSFQMGLAIMVGVATWHLLGSGLAAIPLPSTQTLGIALMLGAVGLGGAAGLSAYGELLGLEEHVTAGRKAGVLYARAEAILGSELAAFRTAEAGEPRARHLARARAVLHEVGREALIENGEWMILHRDRPWEFYPN